MPSTLIADINTLAGPSAHALDANHPHPRLPAPGGLSTSTAQVRQRLTEVDTAPDNHAADTLLIDWK